MPRQPLLIVGVARRGLLHVGDAPHFVLRFALGFAHDRVTGHAKFHRRQLVLRAALAQIRNFFADALRRIAMHQVGVALFRD